VGRVNHGEVWTFKGNAGRSWRGVVLSVDTLNTAAGAYPRVAPIVRRFPESDAVPFTASLSDLDPVSGVVLVAEMLPVDPGRAAEHVGMLTGPSLARVADALRDLFDL
jgi:mRNA interferase MazF